MKRRLTCTVVIVLVLCSVALGQDKKYEIRVGGGVGPSLGSEDFKELYSLAIHFGADVAYYVSPQLTVGGNLNYGRFGLDEDTFLAGQGGTLDGGTLTGFELLGMLRYYLKSRNAAGSTHFYLLGGLGMAFYKQGDIKVVSGNSTFQFKTERQSDPMLSLGAGAKFGSGSKVAFFAEVTLSLVLSDPDNVTYVPLRVGVIF